MSADFSAQSLFGTLSNGSSPSPTYSPYPPGIDRNKLKLKRSRQRVDAGEPRNTYSSIPNYTSNRPPPGTFQRFLLESARMSGACGLDLSTRFGAVDMSGAFGSLPFSTQPPSFDVSLRRDVHSTSDGRASPVERPLDLNVKNVSRSPVSDEEPEDLSHKRMPDRSNSDQDESMEGHGDIDPEPVGSAPEPANSRSESAENSTSKSKRKQYQPQQVTSDTKPKTEPPPTPHVADPDCDDAASDATTPPLQNGVLGGLRGNDEQQHEKPSMDTEMVKQFLLMQQRYVELLAERQAGTRAVDNIPAATRPKQNETTSVGTKRRIPLEDVEDGSPELKSLCVALRKELMQTIKGSVGRIMVEYVESQRSLEPAPPASAALREPAKSPELQPRSTSSPRPATSPIIAPPPQKPPIHGAPTTGVLDMMDWTARAPHPFYINPSLYYNAALSYANAHGSNGTPSQSIFPTFGAPGRAPFFPAPPQSHSHAPQSNLLGKDEAISLVLPKKKRSKVTDTRINKPLPGAPKPEEGGGGFFHSPTMVPQHLMMAGRLYGSFAIDQGSPSNSDGGSDGTCDNGVPKNRTLSPMHLRKAKLMFFYTRYPSSALLKAYFPDIHFDKNNTAQLVKWFSNFREFYYIQMEKYARQALAEGVRAPEEIMVTVDSEIYRVLNLHYNRNNHIAVPPTFPSVIEATLREFYKSIQLGRDMEPSWKKAIYKIIARLDDPIPEYFKSPNFMEQLEG